MKERPIIFNDEMVRAVLAGKKTQTRRVIKPQPSNSPKIIDPYNGNYEHFTGWDGLRMCNGETGNIKNTCHWKPPHGVPGDRLWVREVFAMQHSLEVGEIKPFSDGRPFLFVDEGPEWGKYWSQPHYRATDPTPDLCYEDQAEEGPYCRWASPIWMPRWASRILLEVQEVRVERVRDIGTKDSLAEGCESSIEFWTLWNKINGKKPGRHWDDNPWVWVITFRRM